MSECDKLRVCRIMPSWNLLQTTFVCVCVCVCVVIVENENNQPTTRPTSERRNKQQIKQPNAVNTRRTSHATSMAKCTHSAKYTELLFTGHTSSARKIHPKRCERILGAVWPRNWPHVAYSWPWPCGSIHQKCTQDARDGHSVARADIAPISHDT